MAPPTRALAILAAIALAIAGCGGSDDGDGSDGGSGGSESENERLFSSSGFGEALDAAVDDAGGEAEVISIGVTDGGAEFSLVSGGAAKGLIYTNGQLAELEVAVVGSGPGEQEGFPLSEVDAGAIDAMVAGVAEASGASGLEIVGLTLEPDEGGEPRWTINATGGAGETLTYQAAADGSGLVAADDATREQPGPPPAQPAQPTPATPSAPSVEDAEAALECVQAAEGNVEELQRCAELVQP